MEPEQYFKCPVCGRKVLKRKGIKLMCKQQTIFTYEEIADEKKDKN